jgi:hypothetical protein
MRSFVTDAVIPQSIYVHWFSEFHSARLSNSVIVSSGGTGGNRGTSSGGGFLMFIPKDLNDRSEYPDMVRWFSPVVLAKTVNKVLASTLFGQYADRRLIHASLDKLEGEDALRARCGDGKSFCDAEGTVRVDYVADLGDGFDSTYAIAYLIGKKEIEIEGAGKLPRAQCLVMGGDQVYPDASRDDYEKRMQRPYRFAFPNSVAEGGTSSRLSHSRQSRLV